MAGSLPIEDVLAELRAALGEAPNAVLVAPPGAGKTTRVPLALLQEPWLGDRRIVVLEPRRLAARAAARRMAATLGEEVGETVGYRVHLDSRVGPKTRIEVMTEGILTRRLLGDPGLEEIGAVLFDEFHERNLNADLGLALTLETQAALRPDLRILVMSATIDGAAVARLLGSAPVIESQGRAYPVETRHLGDVALTEIEAAAVDAVRRALAEEGGSLLVFLPGEREIRRVADRLGDLGAETTVHPLYGSVPAREQDEAIRPPAAGRRKIVLATSIAETSLTIEGVRVVVDAGLARVSRFDPRTGMSRLETVRTSRASADQRRGRAGRTEPGICYRLWSEAAERAMPPAMPAEILVADLAPLALDLAVWGASDPSSLAWLDAPPTAAMAQARSLLRDLDALGDDGRITAHGRRMSELPLHPRLAHMVLAGAERGSGSRACEVAALLSERDVLTAAVRDPDLRRRLEALNGAADPQAHRGRVAEARQAAADWRRRLRVPRESRSLSVGALVAMAYPGRVAQRRGTAGQYRLANGRGAVLPPEDPLAREEFLAIADLDDAGRDVRVYLAAPLMRSEIDELFGGRIETDEDVRWDERAETVIAARRVRLGALVLDETRLETADAEARTQAMVDGVRAMGLGALPWTPGLRGFQARNLFVHRLDPSWPDFADGALLAGLETWLAPYLGGVSRRAHLARIDLAAALDAKLDWQQRKTLDALAPTHIDVPSGSRIALDYDSDPPVLAVKPQEMFGQIDTPKVGGGRIPVVIHLLSPAGRPLQVTQDLGNFWRSGYAAVRAELRGRYPKHPWPEDPLTAPPTRRTKTRTERTPSV
ncbi:MAG: ATP-dependent helicase HrpB [Alphaproteobacteria bacterium]|nr:ATP-dependent helicase HrpB [Alphaproteobacteria bacterium]